MFLVVIPICNLLQLKIGFSQPNVVRSINGTLVSGTDSKNISGALVQLKQSHLSVYSELNGSFSIQIAADDTLVITLMEFETTIIPIEFSHTNIDLGKIILRQKANELDAITVQAKSENKRKKEEPFNISVANAKLFENRPGDISQIANQMSGIKLRFNGGVGSDYNLMLLGMGGNAVRILKDGIPLEYFGKGFQLNNIPVQNIDRIEVYKGAVPIYLGSDALGGAVNIVSSPVRNHSIDVSLEVGSFNTYRSAMSVFLPNKNNDILFGISSHLNYSKNNYLTDVQTANFNTGVISDTTIERFHDNFLSFLLVPQIHILRRKWTDDFTVNIGFGEIHKQLQHGFLLTIIPVGEAVYKEKYIPISINYRKSFREKHLLQVNSIYNYTQTQFIDTTSSIYSWNGLNTTQNTQTEFGEIGYKSTATQQRGSFVSRLYYRYKTNEQNNVELATTTTVFRRGGNDDLMKENLGFNPLENTSHLIKNILGISYSHSSFNQKWHVTVSGKHFLTRISGTENIVTIPIPPQSLVSASQFLGGNMAIKYQMNNTTFIRASYEYAGRLPNEAEALGDGLFINGNPNLLPEKSHNFNIGFVYQSKIEHTPSVRLEVNGFKRFVEDIIVLQNAQFIPQYDNLFKAQGVGGEAEASITLKNDIRLSSNITYIDFRKKGFQDLTDKPLDGKRIPNIPYFFSNTSFIGTIKNITSKKASIQFYTNYQFVYEYYLYFDGGITNIKPTIPTQHNVDAGVTYTLQNGKYNFSFETRNIINNNLFDNFRVQRPGRGFYGKINLNM
jgi:outer membrane receptor protein involved in Fe transport